MKKSFESVRNEAHQYGVLVYWRGDKVTFVVGRETVAWMYRTPGGWTGYTSIPEITGTKTDTKGAVADWCLEWAANGF